MLLTALGLPEDMSQSSLCFSIEGPMFFVRFAVTMILKRFVKPDVSVYYKYSRKYEVKMTLTT